MSPTTMARRVRVGTARHTAAAMVAVLTMSLAACGGDDGGAAGSPLDALKKTGTIRIGVANALPTSGAEQTPTGLVPELTAMVFAKLGVKNATAVPMDFGALIPSLQSGRIDVAAGGFYVTAERCKAITLADPSFYYLDGMAVAKGNPHKIKTFEDIARAKVDMGAISGSATIQQAQTAGVDKAKIHEYADVPTMLDALKAGRIAAAPYDNVTIAWELAKPGYSDLSATEPTAPIVNGAPQPYSVSVGFTKAAGALAEAFNKTQAEMFAAGEFDALIAKWNLPKESIRPVNAPSINKICAA